MIKLIGVAIVILGFALRRDTIATVVVAGLATGFAAGLRPLEILDILGVAFIENRTASLFVLALPVIGILERYGLKEKAVDFIRGIGRATAGKVLTAYLALRSLASAFSLRLGGHLQFVRPLVYPMAEGAAEGDGPLDGRARDAVKGASAAMENYGNFFAQNVFMGASGTLLIVTTLRGQGYDVDAMRVALWSVPVALCAVALGAVQNLLLDRRLRRTTRAGGGEKP